MATPHESISLIMEKLSLFDVEVLELKLAKQVDRSYFPYSITPGRSELSLFIAPVPFDRYSTKKSASFNLIIVSSKVFVGERQGRHV